MRIEGRDMGDRRRGRAPGRPRERSQAQRESPFKKAAAEILRNTEDRPLNLGRFKHAQIEAGLHGLLYDTRDGGFSRDHLRLLYGDGSEPRPFPVPVSPPAEPPAPEPRERPLRVGFVSGRHPELDAVVDFYLLRNRELDAFETFAEQEQEVCERTLRLFEDPDFGGFPAIEAYHTGVEPATLGFYRAVVESIGGVRPVLPKIWTGAEVNVSRLVSQSRGGMKYRPLKEALKTPVRRLRQFLDLSEDGAGQLMLYWRPSRPMWEAERDRLCHEAPSAAAVFHQLYRRAQYRTGRPWGLR
jgi:hypothetical protein